MSVRRIVLITLSTCCLLVIGLIITTSLKDLIKNAAVSAFRMTGPAFRGSCLPRGEVPPENTSIGIISFNGVKDELYEVGGMTAYLVPIHCKLCSRVGTVPLHYKAPPTTDDFPDP